MRRVVILQVGVSKTRSRVFSGRVSCQDVSLSPHLGKSLVHHPFLPDHRGTSQSPLFDYPNNNQKGFKKVFTVQKLGIHRIERCVVGLTMFSNVYVPLGIEKVLSTLISTREGISFYLPFFLFGVQCVSVFYFQVQLTYTFIKHQYNQPQIYLYSQDLFIILITIREYNSSQVRNQMIGGYFKI